ncbi:hypothetical protein VYU27_007397 [Nannochloropsis oceanica]
MRILLLPLLLLCMVTPRSEADDVIAPWSQALRNHLLQNQISNSETTRLLAMLHVAQHLAVQDFLQTHGLTADNQQAQHSPDLQPELQAAVAGAGKQVLDQIAPRASATAMPLFNFQTQMQLGRNNVPQQRLREAEARGAQVANQMLAVRLNDASDRTLATPWMGTDEPGKWRATPPDFHAAEDVQWAKVTPWVLNSTTLSQEFRMPPPPPLNSEVYRESYIELKELGRSASTTRTPDMSDKAEFWANNPQLIWMQALDQLTAVAPNSPDANPMMPRLQLQVTGVEDDMNGGGAGTEGVNGSDFGGQLGTNLQAFPAQAGGSNNLPVQDPNVPTNALGLPMPTQNANAPPSVPGQNPIGLPVNNQQQQQIQQQQQLQQQQQQAQQQQQIQQQQNQQQQNQQWNQQQQNQQWNNNDWNQQQQQNQQWNNNDWNQQQQNQQWNNNDWNQQQQQNQQWNNNDWNQQQQNQQWNNNDWNQQQQQNQQWNNNDWNQQQQNQQWNNNDWNQQQQNQQWNNNDWNQQQQWNNNNNNWNQQQQQNQWNNNDWNQQQQWNNNNDWNQQQQWNNNNNWNQQQQWNNNDWNQQQQTQQKENDWQNQKANGDAWKANDSLNDLVKLTPDGRVTLSIPEAARAYAMASVAAMDTRVAAFDNTYFYNTWRPITAIRTGNEGQDMEASSNWEPFRVTPATPEYPNGHASLGGAMAEVLAEVANSGKDEAPFPLVLTAPDGQRRTYHSMSQIADDCAVSRVYSGGHWRHTTSPSIALGKQVGQTVIKQFDDKYEATTAAETLKQQQQQAAAGQEILTSSGDAQVRVQPKMQGQEHVGVLSQQVEPMTKQPDTLPNVQQPIMEQDTVAEQPHETPEQARRRRKREREGKRFLRA